MPPVAGSGVALERMQASMARFGNQARRCDVRPGELGERGVAQLADWPATKHRAEQSQDPG